MAEMKTKLKNASVEDFLNSIADETKRADSQAISNLMAQVSGAEPKMWGDNIIGFGERHYKYESGREGDWFLVGFSPRKQNLTLYLVNDVEPHKDLLQKLGKHKLGKSCLYINKLSDIDMTTLHQLVKASVDSALDQTP